ncbi:MAG: carboxypeptidase-like regulatory domain-containing protein, partial [Bacteroidaceae bacterium]|nr:carboxypeptidase-like regulatory domain-containing protein [Bacteroidaceae bacterium]
MNLKIYISIILALVTSALPAQKVTFKGRVTDENRNPIEIANIKVVGESVGTVADLNGNYQLTCESRDSLVLSFSMLGYQTRKRSFRNPVDTIVLNVVLPSLDMTLQAVEVVDKERQMGSTQKIDMPGKLRLNPSSSGGGIEDIIKSQAGVSSHNELSSQYNVRGGNFDENSVYVNGIEVYRPLLIRAGQQEGLSFVNPDMVGAIAFSTGGFEAKYGDKMSSVLDITYRKPREFESTASAGLLGASLYAGWGNSNVSFSNSVRYKSNRYLLGTLDTKGEYEPEFIDYQAFFDWRITGKLNLSVIANVARNEYMFTPSDRTTSFGTLENVKEFKVYFGGWESDLFNTLFGAVSLNYAPNEYNMFTLQTSAFSTREEETYDIIGEYWLDDINSDRTMAVGGYMEHARNYLDADVRTVSLSGKHYLASNDMRWGVEYKREVFSDNMREWELRDSAGYNIPNSSSVLRPVYSLLSRSSCSTDKFSAYIQNTYKFSCSLGLVSLTAGARLSHWSWNNELLFSPRVSAGLVPEFNKDLTLRLAAGVYYQTPFYKEMRDTVTAGGITTVRLNENIKSQRSIHFVAGCDYRFEMLGRPFKFTAEAYYKKLDNLIPYNVDNVRIVYYGENCAKGYATGLDLKLFGEFVPGTDSWITFSILDTKERINGGDWLPRPTNSRFNASLYFTDFFPGTDRWKMSLQAAYADGLPFGPPYTGREKQRFNAPAYKRVDIGMSYRLLNNEDDIYRTGIYRYMRNVWLGIDAFNLLDINNVNSYYWVSDVDNNNYAVPNYLTGRRLNFRLL